MDLNNMDLSASLVAEFYKTHLVETAIVKSATQPAKTGNKETKKELAYLGKNKKNICLLVSYADDVYLPDDQLNFLTAILQACQLNLGDVAIVNNARTKLSFEELRKQITCNYLLIFGVNTGQIGIEEIPMYTIQNISDCYVVYSAAAEQLNTKDAESKMLKSKLWNCLKQLFNV